jgi:hypothetical protein
MDKSPLNITESTMVCTTVIHSHQQTGTHTSLQHQVAGGGGANSYCLRQAIRLNHEGVVLLTMSREAQALDRFKLGLTQLKSGIVKQVEQGERLPPFGQQHCGVTPVPLVFCPAGFVEEEHIYLYKSAFTVEADESSSRLISVDMMSAVIIYNMALCISLKSIRMNSSNLQDRSLRLYEMCLSLLNPVCGAAGKDTAGCHLLLLAACSNNIAQVAYQRCDYDHARSMMCSLQHLLSITLEKRRREPHCHDHSGDQEEQASLFEECPFADADIQGFTLNIMCSSPPMTARAA